MQGTREHATLHKSHTVEHKVIVETPQPCVQIIIQQCAKTIKTEKYCTIAILKKLSMHSISTDHSELVCFSGGHFANPVVSCFKRINGTYRKHQLGG